MTVTWQMPRSALFEVITLRVSAATKYALARFNRSVWRSSLLVLFVLIVAQVAAALRTRTVAAAADTLKMAVASAMPKVRFTV